MPKIIGNPVSLIVTVEFDDGTPSIESSRADYGIHYSEYPDEEARRKSCPVTFSSEQETQILQFMNQVVKPQVEAHEGISS